MSDHDPARRLFLSAAPASAAAACGLIAAGKNTDASEIAGRSSPPRLPREVRIATVSLDRMESSSPAGMVERVLGVMRRAAAAKPDLVCLPETFTTINVRGERPPLSSVADSPLEKLCRPIVDFAAEHRCYVVCPTYAERDGKIYNTAFLIDRSGNEVGRYWKTRATPDEMEKGVAPGPVEPPVFDTDFGRLGMQICFDIEWPEGWRALRDKGAEIVVWPSAFAGGRQVNMMACMNRYVVVSSTAKDTSKICDVAGDELAATSRWHQWALATENLEKIFLHTWPVVQKFEAIQAKYGDRVAIRTYPEEEWSIVESRSPELRIADIVREFDLVQIDDMLRDAERLQNAARTA